MVINKNLIGSFVRATERAAYGASLYRGKGDKIAADQSAVDEMRKQLNTINMKGRIVIGEGEMDEAPMLYVNEEVGTGFGDELDIAVDPLEGTNFTVKNLPNALSVIAVSKKGNLLHAPDIYMEKIAIGPGYPKNLVDLDFSVKKNIELLSEAKSTSPNKLSACVLNRPRHDKIIDSLKSLGVKINYITDGDVSGALLVCDEKYNVDLFLGIGGGPEGVLSASALDAYNCQFQGRFIFKDEKDISRAKEMGIKELDKKYDLKEIVTGDSIFCATGITSGDLVSGIKVNNNKFISETLVTHKSSNFKKVIRQENNLIV